MSGPAKSAMDQLSAMAKLVTIGVWPDASVTLRWVDAEGRWHQTHAQSLDQAATQALDKEMRRMAYAEQLRLLEEERI